MRIIAHAHSVPLWRVLLLAGWLLAVAPARAERLSSKTYTTAAGLAQDRVKRIVPDSHGFLWFCTADGLSRFDGYRFTNYDATQGLSFPSINDLLETRRGVYWLATNGGGVLRFNWQAGQQSLTDTSRFTVYPVGDNSRTNRVNRLYEDEAGHTWAGTDDGLFVWDEGQGKFLPVALGAAAAPGRFVQVWAFVEDAAHDLWLGTSAGLVRRQAGGRVLHYPPPAQRPQSVHDLLRDRAGHLWAATGAGLLVFNPAPAGGAAAASGASPWPARARSGAGVRAQQQFTLPAAPGEARLYTRADGLSYDDVRMLHETTDGHVWLAAWGGLTEIADGRVQNYGRAQGLGDALLNAIAEDRDGNLWLGTHTGGAIKIAGHGLITYLQADGLSDTNVRGLFNDHTGALCVTTLTPDVHQLADPAFNAVALNLPATVTELNQVLQDRAGAWWVATNRGLFRTPPLASGAQLAHARPQPVLLDEHASPFVSRLFEDSRGDIWMGTGGPSVVRRWERASGQLQHYTAADGLPEQNRPLAFAEDKTGDIWIGLREGGLARYHAGRFQLLTSADGLPPGEVRVVYIDAAGRLWLGIGNSGLVRVDDPSAARLRFASYTTTDGLTSDIVRTLTADNAGRLYVGTTRSIDRLDPANGHIKHYTTADGLGSNETNIAYTDPAGVLWFGTANGLSRLVPEPERLTPAPPPVLIGGLRVAGQTYRLSELGETDVRGLQFTHAQNQMAIDFLGLGFAAGEVLRYQYMLAGADAAWSAPTEQRTINYANLRPGAYRFLVRAINAEGDISPAPASVAFTISAPLWQRPWFVTLVGLTVGALVFALDRYRIARARALAAALAESRASEARFRTLAETASDAIITIDEASIIQFANPATETVFGYTLAEMIGRDLTMLMPEYLRHLHNAGFARYVATGRRHLHWAAIELPGLHKSGREIPLEISFGEFTRNEQRYFTGIARDVSERKRAEEALRRSREERLIELERVRKRIATDLHDDIGSSLTQISILSEVVSQRLGADAGAATQPLALIAHSSREVVDAMSDIVWAINPQKDHLSDLTQRMRRFASDVFTARNIAFQFNAPDAAHDRQLGANVRREVFLIFKECVNNMVKHADCTQVEIAFALTGAELALRLADNGRGFDPAQESEGHGLLSMRERAQGLGGTLAIISQTGQGTLTTLTVPLTESGLNQSTGTWDTEQR